MATVATNRELIDAVAAEMSEGIESAVSFWMTQIENALHDPRLTTVGRMNAIQEILQRYKTADSSGAGHDGYAA